jgi:signal transduction histidine kinase
MRQAFQRARYASVNQRPGKYKRSHADPQHVSIALAHDCDQLTLTISDDGRGFDATAVSADRFGLTGMRERTAMIGGQLVVDSAAARGTTVQLSITIGV